jgi:hypothetical protein
MHLQVRPTLLNSQEWLRFWVEEHLVLPNGTAGKGALRGRRTTSLNSRPNSLPGCSGEPLADGTAADAVSGRQALAAMAGCGAAGSGSQAQVKAIKYETRCIGVGHCGLLVGGDVFCIQLLCGGVSSMLQGPHAGFFCCWLDPH